MLEITGEAPDHIVTTRVNAPPRVPHVNATNRSSDLIATKRSAMFVNPVHGAAGEPGAIDTRKRGATHNKHVVDVSAEGESATTRANATPGVQVANQEPTRSRFEDAALRVQARDVLVGLGWKIGIASSAVEEARAHVGATATLEAWIREALRRCPLPRS